MGGAWDEIVHHKYFGVVVRVAVLAVIVVRALGALPEVTAEAVEGQSDPRGFKFLRVDRDTGEPVRYPCSDLHYVINPSSASADAIADVHVAIRETSEATGVTFVYDGLTDEAPSPERPSYQPDRYGPRWAPILIAWQPGLEAQGGVHPIGLGGSASIPNDQGRYVYVSGQVVFDSTGELNAGFGGKTWGQVMLHELGHVMGLDHVDHVDQVMNPTLGLRPAAWGTGDRIGLRALGIGSACVRAPDLP